MRRLASALVLLSLSASAIAQTAAAPASRPAPTPAEVNARLAAPLPADQAAMKAHVLFLASDAMKGREAGSGEYDIAAQYVAAQFYAAGLRPGGDEGGYLQQVPLVSYKAGGEGTFVLSRGGAPMPLAFGVDYIPAANPARAETSVTAPVVFAGYGITAPKYGRDDYKGVDVRGRIVALFAGAPAGFDGEERAFFASAATKARLAAARGAVGIVLLSSPKSEKTRPFARSVEGYRAARMTWAKPDGTGSLDTPGTPLLGTLSLAGAQKLFAGARTPWSAIAAEAAKDNAAFRAEALPGTLSVATRTTFEPAQSSNVIGVIPGADPKLKDEVVVLSAHLDHIGVKASGAGDRINNGALDNAIGIASLIEEAKRFKTAPPPRRTVLFLAVTAEEKGLIGSDYFANHPTVPIKGIVADVNLDMPILTYPFEDMVVFGAERSTLGPIVEKAVKAIGVTLSPDPMPDEGIFVRSDHFRFVQKGIPSVFLWPGQKGPGKAAVEAFMSQCYHRPCDELAQQPVLWDQGIRFVDANYRIAREIADGDARPVWNKGDYFGTLFKGPMAR